MALFTEMDNTQAFLKCAILGFAGSGKTTTATNIAVGLVKLMREREIPQGDRPIFFLDTESGSDWVKRHLEIDNIRLMAAKTRAFKDLIEGVSQAEKNGSVLIVDSLTHYWKELCDSYQHKKAEKLKTKNIRLSFADWGVLKSEWARFTDAFINSNLHIILCGRAGFEYDFFEDDEGKKELQKTGIKMKAEGETGYEASLLVSMERHQEIQHGKVVKQYRTATILKDRSREIDGKVFINPTFNDFKPHIFYLNIGGNHVGVDTNRNSDEIFDMEGKPRWQFDKEQKEISLEEIKELLVKHYPSTSVAEKQIKADLLDKYFGTRTWSRIETLSRDIIESGRNELWLHLEGKPYHFEPPKPTVDAIEKIEDSVPDFEQAQPESAAPVVHAPINEQAAAEPIPSQQDGEPAVQEALL